MNIKHVVPLLLMFFLSGCSGSISGTVVDAETGLPIEGAVVLVEWTKTKGMPGLTYGETYKTVEAVTKKDGIFRISGVLNPFVNSPIIVVYKKGYVAWSNNYIFPSWKRREEFKYESGLTIKLEEFKKEYSLADHVSFISSAAVSGSGGHSLDAAYLWERDLARKEAEKGKVKSKMIEGR
jgi:hypothetical protein